ncbi:hypothetical protein GF359_05640 [candidate division WOR-3 bacterium]|uniref:Lipoprotein n=1 Tax=candidate division WOR-3 bacterium TaxID=2052148 RepID=A0A9D5QCL2_UNCW3|nr:hypothetical protein [candidate division WOR-3 bacterium]MBD3364679.1 hypothetical protein [candidate division WOR-3 bacterium]
MKYMKYTVVAAIGVLLLSSCLPPSPDYGTARINQGWNLDVGGSLEVNIYTASSSSYSMLSVSGNAGFQYGFNDYFQLDGRFHFGPQIGPLFSDGIVLTPDLFLDFGLQVSLPLGKVTPAIHADLYPLSSLGVLLGLGDKEFLTFGGNVYPDWSLKYTVLMSMP